MADLRGVLPLDVFCILYMSLINTLFAAPLKQFQIRRRSAFYASRVSVEQGLELQPKERVLEQVSGVNLSTKNLIGTNI